MQGCGVRSGTVILIILIMFSGFNAVIASNEESTSIQYLEVIVEDTMFHNNSSWTQGLLIVEGSIFESTGLYNSSSLKKINISSGEIEKIFYHNESIFAEGLAYHNNKLIQLTYKSNIAFVFDMESFEIIDSYDYSGEGWGLCTMPDFFVMSNGSSKLGLRDLETFELIKEINVTRNGSPVPYLNELECVGDLIYSNVWMTDEIIAIDRDSGNVVKSINASNLINKSVYPDANVLNGIAFDKEESNFWITGKFWPHVLKVEFSEVETQEIITEIPPVEENISSNLENTHTFFESDFFIIFSLLFLLALIVIWIIDVKIRSKSEKTQVKDSSGEYNG